MAATSDAPPRFMIGRTHCRICGQISASPEIVRTDDEGMWLLCRHCGKVFLRLTPEEADEVSRELRRKSRHDYYIANKEKRKEYYKRYAKNHPEQDKARRKRYYERHREEKAEYNRAYYQQHKDELFLKAKKRMLKKLREPTDESR